MLFNNACVVAASHVWPWLHLPVHFSLNPDAAIASGQGPNARGNDTEDMDTSLGTG